MESELDKLKVQMQGNLLEEIVEDEMDYEEDLPPQRKMSFNKQTR